MDRDIAETDRPDFLPARRKLWIEYDQAAAAEMKKAAAYCRIEAKRATDDARKGLVATGNELAEDVGSSIEECGKQTELLGKHISSKTG